MQKGRKTTRETSKTSNTGKYINTSNLDVVTSFVGVSAFRPKKINLESSNLPPCPYQVVVLLDFAMFAKFAI